jgi:uncharacterized membrane protein (DUF106 family)
MAGENPPMADATKPAPGAAPKGSPSTMLLMMMLFIILIFVMDPNVRVSLGGAVGGLFTPVFGFGGAFPVWTLFACSVVLVIFTTTVRHFFTNWVDQGRQKHLSTWIQSQYKEVRLKGNVTKMKKLNEHQANMMKQSTDAMGSQMKTTLVTIVVAMAIFLWLGVFMYNGTLTHYLSVPWASTVDYTHPGPFIHVMPTWILLYSVISMPLGQVLQTALKIWSFRRKLNTLPDVPAGKKGVDSG